MTFPCENPLGEGQGVFFGETGKSNKGLIVIHEWWGKNDQIQEQGAMLANQGNLLVLVIDMYR